MDPTTYVYKPTSTGIEPEVPLRMKLRSTVPYLLLTVVTVLCLFTLLGLRDVNFSDPIQPLANDGYLSAYLSKALGENSLLHNNRVGAPLGLDYYDFYQPDFVHQEIVKCLALVSGNGLLAMNIYFLASFVLIALAAFYVFRRFDLSIGVSLVCAILYAFTPSHLHRSVYHLFLSAYYILPLAAMIALQVMIGRSREEALNTAEIQNAQSFHDSFAFERQEGQQPKHFIRFLCFAILVAILIGGSGVYYAFYSMLFIGSAACYATFRGKNRKLGIAGFACVAVIGLSFAMGMLPKEIYDLRNGSSTQVAQRLSSEELVFSLKLADLFLPIPEHRIPKLRAISQQYIASFPALNANESEYSNLGVVGVIGFSSLLLWPFLRRRHDKYDRLMKCLLVLTIIGLLFATTGGFGSLVALLVTSKLRAHARIVFFLAFFAFLAFGVVLDKVIRRLPRKPSLQVPVTLCLALILIGGLYDESGAGMAIAHGPLKAAYQRDDRFYKQVETQATPGGMVLQLPYQAFPEAPGVNGTDAYSPLRAYLHTKNLRWSFPAMRGRPQDDWIQALSGNPTPALVRKAALAGYCGINVDRRGFQDGAVSFESELRSITQTQPIVSEDSTLSFYSLTSYAAALEKATPPEEWRRLVQEARPNLFLGLFAGVYPLEVSPSRTWHWCNRTGEFEIVNVTGHVEKADLEGYLFSGVPGTFTVWFTTPHQTSQATATVTGNRCRVPLVLEPGLNRISFRTDSPRLLAPADPRELYFQISNMEVIPRL